VAAVERQSSVPSRLCIVTETGGRAICDACVSTADRGPLATMATSMLTPRIVRELSVAAYGSGLAAHLSAASGLVMVGKRAFVVADDELHLGVFDLASTEPGRLIPLFEGNLPASHEARKAGKPDCEALLRLPAFGAYRHGALMALGSGSKPSRERAALLPLDAAGAVGGVARTVDLAPLLATLRIPFPELNIEGAFLQGDALCLLQRGHARAAVNACIELGWPEVAAWLAAGGAVPQARAITRFELGAVDGVPLCFTDGAALPGGGWIFSAAAEDTADSYADGRCAGSAIGLVDATGALQRLEPLSLCCKVEGVAVASVGDAIELLLVTDADDRQRPGLLMSATLARPGGR